MLYYVPGNASIIPHILLEEQGTPYRLHKLDREGGEDQTAEFRALNPNGFVPVLVDEDLTLYETAAIVLHLVDRQPGSKFAPPIGSVARSEFYKWLLWLANTLQPGMKMVFYPQRWADDATGTARIRAMAEEKAGPMLDQLEAQLQDGRPWLLGSDYTAVDPYAAVLCRWTAKFQRPAHARPILRAFMERVLARPAVTRVFEEEGLAKPWL